MHRTKAERQRDNLLGEVTIAILKEHGQITFESLLYRLKFMALSEPEGERLDALNAALVWIMVKAPLYADQQRIVNDETKDAAYIEDDFTKKH